MPPNEAGISIMPLRDVYLLVGDVVAHVEGVPSQEVETQHLCGSARGSVRGLGQAIFPRREEHARVDERLWHAGAVSRAT